MRKKIALLTTFAAVAALALVPSSQAASSSIKVTTSYDFANFCRPAVDQLQYQFVFKAKIKRRNSPLPRNVVVRYRVLDNATGQSYGSGKVTLTKRNKWTNLSNPVIATAGASVTYELTSTYKAPRTGRNVKAKGSFPDQIPTVADLDAANPPLPSCAAVG